MKRGPITKKRRKAKGAAIRSAMAVAGVSGAELHRRLRDDHGIDVSLSTVYNWMQDVGPGPDEATVGAIARAIGLRAPSRLYTTPSL